MKKSLCKSLIIFGIGVLIGSSATAQQNEIASSFDSEVYVAEKEVRVHVLVSRADLESKFTIRVLNEKGQVLYRSAMPKYKQKFQFILNFLEMAEGKYFIEMQNGKEPPVIKVLQKEFTVLAQPITSNKIISLN